jgi:hypothetical protein
LHRAHRARHPCRVHKPRGPACDAADLPAFGAWCRVLVAVVGGLTQPA